MKKLLVFSPYYPPHTGGLESHADEFNKYLSREGMGIVVFTPRLPLDSAEFETRHNDVRIIRFPAFEIVSNYPVPKLWSPRFWRIFSGLLNEDFDIVISRTRFFLTSLLALAYAKLKRRRWIHIEHGSDFVRLSSAFKTAIAKAYDHTFGRLIFKSSDLNISISKAVQKFVQKFDKRESPIIYRGLDIEEIEKIQPDLETKEKFRDKTIISFVGRLYKWKGVESSIEAVKSLPEGIRNKIVFLIIGDGEDFPHLKKISKDEPCIAMLGNLPREKALGILKVTDIYLHSAQPGGGLSTSLLEAMYCGCAVIATPNEGADEVIEDGKNGFLVEKTDSMLILEKLKDLIGKNNSEQKEESRNTVKNKFNWNNSIDAYKIIFDSIRR